MIKFIKKLNKLLTLSAVTAGIIFCLCGFTVRLPNGVTVDGENVGGMNRSAAISCLRSKIEEGLKEKRLIVNSAERRYVFTYPEISYKDDIPKILRSAQKNGNYTSKITYYLCGLDEIASGICLNERTQKVEPYVEFKKSGTPFIYHEGNDGKEVDKLRLKTDILNSLKGGFESVNVKYINVFRNTGIKTLKENTQLLGQFTTYFDGSNTNRSSNIRLAANLLNGTVVEGGKTLSFNDIVGARLKERGFLSAKIIENGEYTEGVGGGVCQVSTTLYNAALLSGLTVTEYHPHSLAVGYVDPSRDAMVSGSACDLKVLNQSKFPVYIRSSTQRDSITFSIYGKSDGAVYSIESVITGSVPAEEEPCQDPALAREGKDGTLSEGYLLITRGGFVKRVKIRNDKYLPVKRLIYPRPEEAAPQIGQSSQDIPPQSPEKQSA